MIVYNDGLNLNKKSENPFEKLAIATLIIVTAPVRLLGEIGKKMIFLGEYTRKMLYLMIILTTGLIVVEASYGLCISHSFNVVEGAVPLGSLAIALVLSILVYSLFDKFKIDINLEAIDGMLETTQSDAKVEEIEKVMNKSLHKTQTENQETNNAESIQLDFDSATLTEKVESNELDIDIESIKNIINSSPKIDRDCVYKGDREVKGDAMNMMLKNSVYGNTDSKTFMDIEEQVLNPDDEFRKSCTFDLEGSEEIELTDEEEGFLLRETADRLHVKSTGEHISDDILRKMSEVD